MRYRWFTSPEKEYDEFGVKLSRAANDAALKPHKFRYRRGELLAIAIAAVIFIYECFVQDLPLLFIALSFIAFELRPLTKMFLGSYGEFASNILKGFSLALFIGTLIWVLI